ncbi:MAG: queuine/other tRNA-ribosyltransferase [Candidatus Thorarchaeota archaeon]|nr:queuine/other tRNA-ribosyltransferase [Candidatus Thorarchaeota archaeon]
MTSIRRMDPDKLSYLIPWWSDYVDSKYNFRTDEPTDGQKVTAHEIYDRPPYDGILASKTKIESNKKNMRRIMKQGIHEYLNFDGPVFGDCGAYGYIDEPEPPYSPTKIADYYHDIGFDYGVSVDHLIVKSVENEKEERFEITLKNAEKFLQRHQEKGYEYVPVGAAQGWDTVSYREAAEELIDMGYDHIAIGGLTRSPTKTVLDMLNSVHGVLERYDQDISVHLFGIARLKAIRKLIRLGVTSFDSASYLRRAWLGAGSNYMMPGDRGYAAIRIPQSDRSPSARKILETGQVDIDTLREIDRGCMNLMRKYDRGEADIDEVMDAILWYDSMLGDDRNHEEHYLKTLKDKPWKECQCAICQNIGVEIIIFRGNNRNRRRGFHNTRVFYNELQRILSQEKEKSGQTFLEDF